MNKRLFIRAALWKVLFSVGICGLFYAQVSPAAGIEQKNCKSHTLFIKHYKCQPLTSIIPSHPTAALAYIHSRGIVATTWDTLSESDFSLSLFAFDGTIVRSVKHTWGFPTHLYYNADQQKIYFWKASDPHQAFSKVAFVLDTNLYVVDTLSISSFADWFIKIGMIKAADQKEIEYLLKKINKEAGEHGSAFAEKDLWRYVTFINNQYILCEREYGCSVISGYDRINRKAFRFNCQSLSADEPNSALATQNCEGLTTSIGDRKLSGGMSGVAISEDEFIISTFSPFSSVEHFQHIKIEKEY